jgi:hypothetical protein
MAFLVIAGVTYPVLTDGASENDAAFGGIDDGDWSFDGSPRFAYSPERRQRTLPLLHMSQAAYESLRSDIAAGIVAVDGDAIAGGPKNAIVRVTSAPYVDDGALGFYIQPTVEITETGT